MSINTGFSIPAKPPAWGCGTNSVPVSLAEQIFRDGYSIHAASASKQQPLHSSTGFHQPEAAQEEFGFKETCTHLIAFTGDGLV